MNQRGAKFARYLMGPEPKDWIGVLGSIYDEDNLSEQLGSLAYYYEKNQNASNVVDDAELLSWLENQNKVAFLPSLNNLESLLKKIHLNAPKSCDKANDFVLNKLRLELSNENDQLSKENASLIYDILKEYCACIFTNYDASKSSTGQMKGLEKSYIDKSTKLSGRLNNYLNFLNEYTTWTEGKNILLKMTGGNCETDVPKFYTYFTSIKAGKGFGNISTRPGGCAILSDN